MEQRQIAITSACLASPVPATTVLRSLNFVQNLDVIDRASLSPRECTSRGSRAATDHEAAAASLLFAPGERVSVDQICALAASEASFHVSFDPEDDFPRDASEPAERWLELMANGLTFDLTGLAPRQQAPLPNASHLFGLSQEFRRRDLEAVTLVPGPSFSSGRPSPAVLRSQAMLAARLAGLPGVKAIAWHGAEAWSAPDYFRTSVLRWIEGGAFPGLGLAALSAKQSGELVSKGLALFIGQELSLAPSLAKDRSVGARIALRIMHWLVDNGPLHQRETLPATGGELLQLAPSRDRRVINVSLV